MKIINHLVAYFPRLVIGNAIVCYCLEDALFQELHLFLCLVRHVCLGWLRHYSPLASMRKELQDISHITSVACFLQNISLKS